MDLYVHSDTAAYLASTSQFFSTLQPAAAVITFIDSQFLLQITYHALEALRRAFILRHRSSYPCEGRVDASFQSLEGCRAASTHMLKRKLYLLHSTKSILKDVQKMYEITTRSVRNLPGLAR